MRDKVPPGWPVGRSPYVKALAASVQESDCGAANGVELAPRSGKQAAPVYVGDNRMHCHGLVGGGVDQTDSDETVQGRVPTPPVPVPGVVLGEVTAHAGSTGINIAVRRSGFSSIAGIGVAAA